jgi:hypothetical protein
MLKAIETYDPHTAPLNTRTKWELFNVFAVSAPLTQPRYSTNFLSSATTGSSLSSQATGQFWLLESHAWLLNPKILTLPNAWVRAETSSSLDLRVSTILEERLRSMKAGHLSMAAQFADAILFAKVFDDALLQPTIWTDDETEVVLEWILGEKRHVFVSFEGDGEFGYALRIDDRFIPGNISGAKPFQVPSDLIAYLSTR